MSLRFTPSFGGTCPPVGGNARAGYKVRVGLNDVVTEVERQQPSGANKMPLRDLAAKYPNLAQHMFEIACVAGAGTVDAGKCIVNMCNAPVDDDCPGTREVDVLAPGATEYERQNVSLCEGGPSTSPVTMDPLMIAQRIDEHIATLSTGNGECSQEEIDRLQVEIDELRNLEIDLANSTGEGNKNNGDAVQGELNKLQANAANSTEREEDASNGSSSGMCIVL